MVCSNRSSKRMAKHHYCAGMKDAEIPEYKKIEPQLKAIEMQKA